MQIEPFGVEMWMNEWETTCTHNLAETCVESLTVGELLKLCGRNDADLADLLPLKMTYGAIEGSPRLREAIAALYEHRTPDDVLVAHGTIGANMLAYRALVSPGDRVVSAVPTYQQHESIPASLGAEVVRLQLCAEDSFLPDPEELARLVRPGARLIALTNPNNPTGALIERGLLEEIAAVARAADAYILCDEVYRGTDQEGGGTTASIADLYEKGVATAGMSKAYSLAGLRLGWITAPRAVIAAAMIHRDYDTISVGMIDDHLAALALEHRERILARSQAITRSNLAVLADWVAAEPAIDWVRPRSGTTALLRYDLDMPSRELCVALIEEEGVMFTPGSVMGMEGHVRIGFANNGETLRAGLERFSRFLKRRAEKRRR